MTLFGQYQIVARRNRKKGNHGGVLVLQKISISCNAINRAPIDFYCAISLNVPDRTVVFILAYLPHRNIRFEVSPGALGSILQTVFGLFSNTLCDSVEFHILADFNLPKTNWCNMSSTCSWESGYLNFLSDKFTSALLHESTHSGGNTRDNVLGNDLQCLSVITTLFACSWTAEAVVAPPLLLPSLYCQPCSTDDCLS